MREIKLKVHPPIPGETTWNIINGLPCGVLVLNSLGEVLLANPWLASVLGYAPRDLVGHKLARILVEGSCDFPRDISLGGGGTNSREWRVQLLARDGRVLPLSAREVELNHPGTRGFVFHGDGQPLPERGSTPRSPARNTALFDHAPLSLWDQDFSRVKNTVDRIQRQEGDVRSYLEAHPTVTRELLEQVRVRDVNAATFRMFGGLTRENLTTTLSRFQTTPILRAFTDQVATFAGGSSTYETEIPFDVPPGPTMWVYIRSAIVPGFERDWACVITSMSDITRLKAVDEGLARIDRIAAMTTLTAGLTHDFNNFLMVISANLTFLQDLLPDATPDVLLVLQDAMTASQHAATLVRNFQAYARGATSTKQLVDLAGTTRTLVRSTTRGSKHSVECHMPGNLWPVGVDESLYVQVLTNLVVNAMQAMPDGGSIWVNAENHLAVQGDPTLLIVGEGYVKVSVRDEGPGIPGRVVPHLFDPYFTTKPRGTGLGLATAYTLVKALGGDLTLASTGPSGTTFSIYLPVTSTPVRDGPPRSHERDLWAK